MIACPVFNLIRKPPTRLSSRLRNPYLSLLPDKKTPFPAFIQIEKPISQPFT
jgi:hypothetical protein